MEAYKINEITNKPTRIEPTIVTDESQVENLVNALELSQIQTHLKEFIDYLDKHIDFWLTKEKKTPMQNIEACIYAHAYEKDKNALINILEGRKFNEFYENGSV